MYTGAICLTLLGQHTTDAFIIWFIPSSMLLVSFDAFWTCVFILCMTSSCFFIWWCTYIPWDDLLWPKNGTKTPSTDSTVITMCENHVSQHNTIYRYKQNKTHYQQQTFEVTDERTESNLTNKRTNERKKQQY